MKRWIVDRKFYSEEESEGMRGEYLDICLLLDFLDSKSDIESYDILESLENEND